MIHERDEISGLGLGLGRREANDQHQAKTYDSRERRDLKGFVLEGREQTAAEYNIT